jgi:hypothetical protein
MILRLFSNSEHKSHQNYKHFSKTQYCAFMATATKIFLIYKFISKHTYNHNFLQINIFKWKRQTILLLLHVHLLPQERVYEAAAWQQWGRGSGGIHRQQGDLTSPLLLFQNRENRQNIIYHTAWKHFPY